MSASLPLGEGVRAYSPEHVAIAEKLLPSPTIRSSDPEGKNMAWVDEAGDFKSALKTPEEIGEDLKSMGAPAEIVDKALNMHRENYRARRQREIELEAQRKAILGNAARNPADLVAYRSFIMERATGLVLATFSSHTAAAQALQLLRNPQWRAPYGKWYMMGSDHVQLHGLAVLAKEAVQNEQA